MRRLTASMLCACLAAAFVQAREYPPLSEEEKVHVDLLLKDSASEEFATRQKAEIGLRDLGEGFMAHLWSASKDVVDPEARQRLNKILAIWAAPRPRRVFKEHATIMLRREQVPEIVKELYEEFVRENTRLRKHFGDYHAMGFLGSGTFNFDAIYDEIRQVFRYRPHEALRALESLPDKEIDLGENRRFSCTPADFLAGALSVRAEVPSPEALAAFENIQAAFEAKQPISEADLIVLRNELFNRSDRNSIEDRLAFCEMSITFSKADLHDFLTTITIQARVRITFEPHELYDEMNGLAITCNIKRTSAANALKEVLTPLGLSYRIEDTHRKHRVVVFKIAQTQK